MILGHLKYPLDADQRQFLRPPAQLRTDYFHVPTHPLFLVLRQWEFRLLPDLHLMHPRPQDAPLRRLAPGPPDTLVTVADKLVHLFLKKTISLTVLYYI